MNRLILQFCAGLQVEGYSQNSIQNHRLDLNRFASWLEKPDKPDLARLEKLKQADVRTYQQHLGHSLKPRSINRHLSSLKLFFKFLEESGLTPISPMRDYTFPKIMPDLPTMLLPTEVALLLDAPKESHYLGLRDRAMLELLYSSGLKLFELIALNIEDLELTLSFVKVKGKSERMVPLTSHAVTLLGRYIEETRSGRLLNPEDPCLFPGRGGKRISRVGIWKLIKKYAVAAGIAKNFNPRTLRHAFAMHLILGGMDLDQIKFLFGYKHLEATSLYAHVNTPDFKAAYQAHHPSASEKKLPG